MDELTDNKKEKFEEIKSFKLLQVNQVFMQLNSQFSI